MVLTKELLLGITLTTLCFPAIANAADEQDNKQQQLEFLSFLAFVGSISDMESAGIDVDKLLTEQPKAIPPSDALPEEAQTEELEGIQ